MGQVTVAISHQLRAWEGAFHVRLFFIKSSGKWQGFSPPASVTQRLSYPKTNIPTHFKNGRRKQASALVFRALFTPHPGPLPWGEGEFPTALAPIQSARTRRNAGCWFPLPEGEGQGEGERDAASQIGWTNSASSIRPPGATAARPLLRVASGAAGGHHNRIPSPEEVAYAE
jgi:hypothetical protein